MYTLWDVETGNLTEEFESLAAALIAVRDDAQQLGPLYAESYALFQETTDQPHLIAEGAELVELAFQSAPKRSSARAS